MDFPKSVPGVGLVDGKFIDEDPLAATPGSLIPSAWGNSVTLELLKVIEEAGLTPDEDDNTQLNVAIDQKISESSVAFASQPEAEAGESATKAMSPLRVFQAIAKVVTQATENAFGWLKIATQAQVTAGINDSSAVTPKKLAARLTEKADLDSPVFVNPATNSTPDLHDNSAKLANTNFVYQELQSYLRSTSESVPGLIQLATSPEVTAGVNDSKAVTPAKLAVRLGTALNSTLGYNRTYVDVTVSRGSGVTYTNSSGAPIQVFLSLDTLSGAEATTVVVGGVTIYSGDPGVAGQRAPLSFIVPNGYGYSVTISGTTIQKWVELR
ncbi:hypothetical protein SAMN03159512_01801 [Pseudomonas sp. NFR09]|uniref:hypothetical protein n=1 Tax=Pseudomonas sp. NFR09 TaxID=1566249 RepID=UPI0008BDA5E1|nr:hypothetical protein [Pseudomonas sp. NFR09]SET27039.1 hypothetical protein SAMN03159512_01801 [Pseudomonas sp. NFR09]